MINYDVYLGGVSTKEWRDEFKRQISNDITVFDPLIDNYQELSNDQMVNQTACQLFHIETWNSLIVFYFNSYWNGIASILELGDSVGRGKQVIVCLDGKITGEEKIRRYCNFHGVLIVKNLEELISTVETYLSEINLCSFVDV